MTQEDWRLRIGEQTPVVDRIVRKRFPGSENLAGEAWQFVMDKISEGEGRRVREYKGTASFEAFFRTMVQRLVTDFIRHRFSRARIPPWVSALGTMWEEIYRRLCWERMPAGHVIETMQQGVPGGRDGAIVEEAVAEILEKDVHCGKPMAREVSTDPSDLPEHERGPLKLSPQERSSEDALALVQLRAVIDYLTGRYDEENPRWDDTLIKGIVDILQQEIQFTVEEELFLKLMRDGVKVLEAGKMVGWDPDQARGKYQRLKMRIRKAFDNPKLSEIKELLDDFLSK